MLSLAPKRLYRFMLQTFVPVFCMTFFIVLFIVLMQFLWRYIDDLVGKGLDVSVIAELFAYAALTMVPMALPLAILLASLMTFGNLGEHFELTAMKAAGVSLLRAMRPLTLVILLIATGAFFFQNDVLPVAQTKMWTLLFSMRQKSPEMDIPERAFYDEIPGYNLYVDSKNRDTGMLYGVTIYENSGTADNPRIIVADSARIDMVPDGEHLKAQFFSGELFENVTRQEGGISSKNMPFRRETFELKTIMIPFDAGFNRMDESAMRNQYVGKNMAELQQTIDELNTRIDSAGNVYATMLINTPYFSIPHDRVGAQDEHDASVPTAVTLDIDSLFNRNNNVGTERLINAALARARQTRQDYEFRSLSMDDTRKNIRRHEIELMKKFTLSFACIIFFFIGAPLGAIIRKGGIGLPLVVSVVLFIIYYIIDNTGYKMARDGRVEVYVGMWLSSAVLLPLGIFLTYKAMHDSAVFNFDAYKAAWQRLRGKHVRSLEAKEFTLEEVEPQRAIEMVNDFDSHLAQVEDTFAAMSLPKRLVYRLRRHKLISACQAEMDRMIDYLSNSRSHYVIAQVNRLPFDLRRRNLRLVRQVNASLIVELQKTDNNTFAND